MNVSTRDGQARGLLPALLESSLSNEIEARFEVDGRSMLPLIRPHDVVRVRSTLDAHPRTGDVVAVRVTPGGGLLVHRIVRVRGDRLLLRGDNTVGDNGEYDRGDILGVVAAVERNGRRVWFGAGRWGGLVALAVRTGWVTRLNRIALCLSRKAKQGAAGGESGAA